MPTTHGRFAALLVIMLFKAFAIIIAFPSTTILLTNSCTSVRVLGTLNGFATTFSGIGRAFGPASTGAAFTWGADNGYIVTAYFYLMAFAIIGAIPPFLIVEGEGPSASADSSDQEDDEAIGDESVFLPDESAIDSDSDEYTEVESSAASSLLNGGKQSNTNYNTMSNGKK